jgi:hypothetical protein
MNISFDRMRPYHLKFNLCICCFLFGWLGPHVGFGQSNSAIVKTATNFVNTLSDAEKKQAVLNFNDTLRVSWTNLPVGMVPRSGIQYGSLSDNSRIAFHEFLTTFLSSRGYLKLTSIMQLDDILNVLYKDAYDKGSIDAAMYKRLQDLKWAHENYFISIWGLPHADSPWGISFGGHHMALSLTLKGESIAFTPLFIGTDPAQIKSSKYAGWRVLSKEEDYGFLLLGMLTKEQREKAVLSQDVPQDIITNPKSIQRIDQYSGIIGSNLTKDQIDVLIILIEEYVHFFEHRMAHQLLDRIKKTGLDKVYFAWIGSPERNKPHYYVINGPDFLIEYDNVGFQSDGNHIHAILREKANDFGVDLLSEHYKTADHHKSRKK